MIFLLANEILKYSEIAALAGLWKLSCVLTRKKFAGMKKLLTFASRNEKNGLVL